MRGVALIVLQILLSLLLTGAVFPLLLLGAPGVRDRWIGPALMYGIPMALFLLLRAIWPRQKP